jgi:hypothetical protein
VRINFLVCRTRHIYMTRLMTHAGVIWLAGLADCRSDGEKRERLDELREKSACRCFCPPPPFLPAEATAFRYRWIVLRQLSSPVQDHP